MKSPTITIEFANPEDAETFFRQASRQIGLKDSDGYPIQIEGPGRSLMVSALGRANKISKKTSGETGSICVSRPTSRKKK